MCNGRFIKISSTYYNYIYHDQIVATLKHLHTYCLILLNWGHFVIYGL